MSSEKEESDGEDLEYLPHVRPFVLPVDQVNGDDHSEANSACEDEEACLTDDSDEEIETTVRKTVRTRRNVYQPLDDKKEDDSPKMPAVNKKESDDLWSSFLSSVPEKDKPIPKINLMPSTTADKNHIRSSKPDNADKSPNHIVKSEPLSLVSTLTKTVVPAKSFPKATAVKIKRTHNNDPLDSLLNSLSGKKPKISTLEKSKLDWNEFITDEGLKDDLRIFNRGRGGYLERKAFEERTDLRQFENEKLMRSISRK